MLTESSTTSSTYSSNSLVCSFCTSTPFSPCGVSKKSSARCAASYPAPPNTFDLKPVCTAPAPAPNIVNATASVNNCSGVGNQLSCNPILALKACPTRSSYISARVPFQPILRKLSFKSTLFLALSKCLVTAIFNGRSWYQLLTPLGTALVNAFLVAPETISPPTNLFNKNKESPTRSEKNSIPWSAYALVNAETKSSPSSTKRSTISSSNTPSSTVKVGDIRCNAWLNACGLLHKFITNASSDPRNTDLPTFFNVLPVPCSFRSFLIAPLFAGPVKLVFTEAKSLANSPALILASAAFNLLGTYPKICAAFLAAFVSAIALADCLTLPAALSIANFSTALPTCFCTALNIATLAARLPAILPKLAIAPPIPPTTPPTTLPTPGTTVPAFAPTKALPPVNAANSAAYAGISVTSLATL